MKRIVLALAMTVGLAIGTVVPVSALGETSVTLNCSDGTSSKLLVDADTLTGLTQAVQAMIDYPAGLTCTLIQNPLGVLFGAVAVASSDPFVVGGGRYQLSCDTPGLPGFVIESRGDPTAPLIASWTRQNTKAGSAYQPLAVGETYWVNIAINDHQKDGGYVGTLNETIPDGQCVPHGHFTSKPTCLTVADSLAEVTAVVTQTSGTTTGNFFPGTNPVVADGTSPSYVQFSFKDNGNPSTGINDLLDGILLAANPEPCPRVSAIPVPAVPLLNGNISVHP
jgi:hypothetical protein